MTQVAANSPASAASLQRDDIITKVGEVSIDETHGYFNTLYKYKPGDKVTLTLMRGTQTVEVEVTLGEAPH